MCGEVHPELVRRCWVWWFDAGLVLAWMERASHCDGELRVGSRLILVLGAPGENSRTQPVFEGSCWFACLLYNISLAFCCYSSNPFPFAPSVLSQETLSQILFPVLKKQFFLCLTSFPKNKSLDIKLLCHSKFIFNPSLHLYKFFECSQYYVLYTFFLKFRNLLIKVLSMCFLVSDILLYNGVISNLFNFSF